MITARTKDAVNLIFRAFSDRTRLRILSILTQGEHCVGDLVEVLKVPQPKVSRHLAYLRKAGLVEAREQGLWNFYRQAPENLGRMLPRFPLVRIVKIFRCTLYSAKQMQDEIKGEAVRSAKWQSS